MKQYGITYEQVFMGEILRDSYIRSVRDELGLQNAVRALYEDPHVFYVEFEELKD